MGKKKKKQGLRNDPAAILKKGEKFFKKGNFLLAKKEFEKLEMPSGQEDLLKKIDICNREIQKENARGLLKRAKKIEKSGNPENALKWFEEAYGVLGEDWIRAKIEQLRNVTETLDVSREARNAEAVGDYLKAAELYDRVSANHDNPNMALRRAGCLVKGEAYAEAVSAFQSIALENPEHIYNFGFSLAKTGKFFECLKTWERIPSRDERFLEQISRVRDLLVCDLYAAFEKQADPERVYKAGKYLLETGYAEPGLSRVVEQCMLAWIEILWENEDFDGIWELLRRNMLKMEPALLPLYAKVGFKRAEKSENHGEDLAMFWLSAVYSERFESQFSDPDTCHGARKLLIDWAENLLKGKSRADEEREKISAQWLLEKEVTALIHALIQHSKKTRLQVLSPRLAAQTGKSSECLALIQKSRRFFKNREEYLRTGCCYSPNWESFYHLVGGEYEKAVQTLVPGESGDEFADYARGRVFFAYGLSCIKTGTRPPDEVPDSLNILFETAPEYEKQFIGKALDAEGLKELQRFEETLMDIHDRRPSNDLAKAMSLVMSRHAFARISKRQITEKVFAMLIKKAMEIDPENEHARGLLEDAQSNLHLEALDKALSRLKMGMACKIVNESESETVREAFFDYLERSVKDIEAEVDSKREQIFYLKDIYKWIVKVDDDHDLLYDIEEIIEELEGENPE
ncbi:MAG: hypothetical protein B6240_14580 [Desulfobacteraceae bacterium 4572_87]|nr:MAG: hypothetical protein B6240_14580 [Desulfobacteraceae bacterium 4572_87]